VSEPRQLRGLVPVEVLALVAVAFIPWPERLPIALPLVVVATLARYVRGRSWEQLVRGPSAAASIGALAGLAALAIAVLAGTPLAEGAYERAIEWSQNPIVRGSGSRLLVVAIMVSVSAVAYELALRGWVVDRVLDFAPRARLAAILAGGVAEALVTPGDLAARLGGLVFGVGLGWMYVAGGRSVTAPICARLTFSVGATFLEAMRVVG
jgi:hypothetical protein